MVDKAGAIRAGRAFVEIFGDDSALARTLRGASARLKAFGARVMAIGAGIRSAGLRMFAAAAAMAVPFAMGAKVFASFEEQMARVSTMLRGADMAFMPQFRKSVREMSVEFGRSTGDITDGLYDILSAQIPASQALEALDASLRAAVAGAATVKDTTSALLTLMETYGDQFKNAADASDFLFAVVRRGRTDLASLAPTIGQAITTAKEAGLSLEDFGASLALVTRAVGGTEMAVTALRAIAGTFLKPATGGAKLWREKFGEAFDYTTLRAQGMLGVLRKLAQLTPGEVAAIFPNVRALRGVLPAIAKLEGFGEDLAAMGGRAGETGVAFDKMAGTLAHFGRQVKRAGVLILSVIGEALAEPLKGAAAAVKEWGSNVADWISKNKDAVRMLAKTVLLIGGVGAGLVILGTVISGIGFTITGLGTVLGIAVVGLKLFGATLAFIFSPLGILLGAILGLGLYLLWATGAGGKALAWLRKKFSELKDIALMSLKGIGDALAAGDIALAAKVLWAGLKVLWQKGTHDLEMIWLDQKHSFLETWTDIYYEFVSIWTKIKAYVSTVAAEMKAMLQAVWAAGKGLVALKLHEWEYRRAGAALKEKRARGEIGEKEFQEEWAALWKRTAAKRLQIVGETDKAIAGGAEDLKNRLLAIEREKNAALRKIAVDAAAARAKLAQAAGEGIAAAEKELADAQIALIEAVEDAAEARWRAGLPPEAGGPPGAGEAPRWAAEDLAASLGEAVRRTFAAAGAWGPSEMRALAARPLEDRMLKAAERTADNTDDLLDEVRDDEGESFAP